ncbi:MAG: diguanylate cyclase [Actinomycetota bacterium]
MTTQRSDDRGRSRPTEAPAWAATIGPIAVVLLAGIAVASFLTAARIDSTDDASIEDGRAAAIFQTRNQLGFLHYELLTDGLLAEATGAGLDPDRFQSYRSDIDAELAQLEALVADLDPDAPEVREVAAVVELNRSVDTAEWPIPAGRLEMLHFESFDIFDGLGNETDMTLDELQYTTMLPRLVLADGLAVHFDRDPVPAPAWAADFLDETFQIVRDAPGWLGPDRNDPLSQSMAGPGDATALPGADDNPDLQLVWDYDQWLIETTGGADGSDPPFAIDELHRATVAAETRLRQGLAAVVDAPEPDELGDGPGLAEIFTWLAVAAGLATAGAMALVVMRQTRERQALADAAYTDGLTGTRNRRFLDEEIGDRCLRRGHQHLIVVIDLDRFKLVNDTWGHDAGDALLIAVSQRLEQVVEGLVARSSAATGTVVRLGGDEFVVALHTPDRFSVDEVEARLRAIAGPIDLGVEAPVALEFSLGSATTFEPADLGDLLKAADLQTYEDKRRRRTAYPDGEGPAARDEPVQPTLHHVDLR